MHTRPCLVGSGRPPLVAGSSVPSPVPIARRAEEAPLAEESSANAAAPNANRCSAMFVHHPCDGDRFTIGNASTDGDRFVSIGCGHSTGGVTASESPSTAAHTFVSFPLAGACAADSPWVRIAPPSRYSGLPSTLAVPRPIVGGTPSLFCDSITSLHAHHGSPQPAAAAEPSPSQPQQCQQALRASATATTLPAMDCDRQHASAAAATCTAADRDRQRPESASAEGAINNSSPLLIPFGVTGALCDMKAPTAAIGPFPAAPFVHRLHNNNSINNTRPLSPPPPRPFFAPIATRRDDGIEATFRPIVSCHVDPVNCSPLPLFGAAAPSATRVCSEERRISAANPASDVALYQCRSLVSGVGVVTADNDGPDGAVGSASFTLRLAQRGAASGSGGGGTEEEESRLLPRVVAVSSGTGRHTTGKVSTAANASHAYGTALRRRLGPSDSGGAEDSRLWPVAATDVRFSFPMPHLPYRPAEERGGGGNDGVVAVRAFSDVYHRRRDRSRRRPKAQPQPQHWHFRRTPSPSYSSPSAVLPFFAAGAGGRGSGLCGASLASLRPSDITADAAARMTSSLTARRSSREEALLSGDRFACVGIREPLDLLFPLPTASCDGEASTEPTNPSLQFLQFGAIAETSTALEECSPGNVSTLSCHSSPQSQVSSPRQQLPFPSPLSDCEAFDCPQPSGCTVGLAPSSFLMPTVPEDGAAGLAHEPFRVHCPLLSLFSSGRGEGEDPLAGAEGVFPPGPDALLNYDTCDEESPLPLRSPLSYPHGGDRGLHASALASLHGLDVNVDIRMLSPLAVRRQRDERHECLFGFSLFPNRAARSFRRRGHASDAGTTSSEGSSQGYNEDSCNNPFAALLVEAGGSAADGFCRAARGRRRPPPLLLPASAAIAAPLPALLEDHTDGEESTGVAQQNAALPHFLTLPVPKLMATPTCVRPRSRSPSPAEVPWRSNGSPLTPARAFVSSLPPLSPVPVGPLHVCSDAGSLPRALLKGSTAPPPSGRAFLLESLALIGGATSDSAGCPTLNIKKPCIFTSEMRSGSLDRLPAFLSVTAEPHRSSPVPMFAAEEGEPKNSGIRGPSLRPSGHVRGANACQRLPACMGATLDSSRCSFAKTGHADEFY